MELSKETRNRRYKQALRNIRKNCHNYWICHNIVPRFYSSEYKELKEMYPELDLLFPKDWTGDSLTYKVDFYMPEECRELREIILLFAIEMTE